MPRETRPVPGDPSGPMIESMMDIRGEDWWITQTGEVKTGAVETIRVDGSQFQRVIAVELPVRRNHDTELATLRVMIHPETALLLAENLAHTGAWLVKLERGTRDVGGDDGSDVDDDHLFVDRWAKASPGPPMAGHAAPVKRQHTGLPLASLRRPLDRCHFGRGWSTRRWP